MYWKSLIALGAITSIVAAVSIPRSLALLPNRLASTSLLANQSVSDEEQPIQIISGHENSVNSIAISPDGKSFVSSSTDWTMKMWSLSDGRELLTKKTLGKNAVSLAFTPDGKSVAAGVGREIRIWDLTNAKKQYGVLLGKHEGIVRSIAISRRGKILASASPDKTIKLWDLESGELVETLTGHTDWVFSVAITPNEQVLVSSSGGFDRTIKFWNLRNFQLTRTTPQQPGWIDDIAIDEDGKILFAAVNKVVKVLDFETLEELNTFTGHSGAILSLAIDRDKRILASASQDGTIKLWDLFNGELMTTLKGHEDWVMSIAISPDGTTLVSGSRDKTIRIWDIEKFQFF
ncbi:MAG: WD40 repeat domain-containing protein [Prochloraceae cyanobacterium]